MCFPLFSKFYSETEIILSSVLINVLNANSPRESGHKAKLTNAPGVSVWGGGLWVAGEGTSPRVTDGYCVTGQLVTVRTWLQSGQRDGSLEETQGCRGPQTGANCHEKGAITGNVQRPQRPPQSHRSCSRAQITAPRRNPCLCPENSELTLQDSVS